MKYETVLKTIGRVLTGNCNLKWVPELSGARFFEGIIPPLTLGGTADDSCKA